MRRRRIKRRQRRRRGLHIPFNGGLVRGRVRPPTTTGSPWNTYVLTMQWKGPASVTPTSSLVCVTVADVVKLLKSELGIADTIVLRVTRVDVWTTPNLANTPRNYIVLSPTDFSSRAGDCENTSQMNWFEAWGTATTPAHCHYVWPKSISNTVLNEGTTRLFKLDVIDNVEYIFKIHMLWRPLKPDLRPTVKGNFFSVGTWRRDQCNYDTGMSPPVFVDMD